jgi:hypothetical protein
MDEIPFDNVIAPGAERGRKKATEKAAPAEERPASGPGDASPSDKPKRSLEKGDLPEAVKRVYVADPAKFGAFVDYYAGADAKRPAFRDHGSKLSAQTNDPTAIKHMIDIAEHRGWSSLQVSGADDFRREVWREAAARGLQVKGYTPTGRDRAMQKEGPDAEAAKGPGIDEKVLNPKLQRLDLDGGVEGRLIATGRSPFQNEKGAAVTAFVRLEREYGEPIEVWGAGLKDALRKSCAKVGDVVRVRRDGKDVGHQADEIDVSGEKFGERDGRRNRWVVEKLDRAQDRFRRGSSSAAARDPDLQAAQSHLAVLETLARERFPEGDTRRRVIRQARELIAVELGKGRTFEMAPVGESQRVKSDQGLEKTGRESSGTVGRRDGPERARTR